MNLKNIFFILLCCISLIGVSVTGQETNVSTDEVFQFGSQKIRIPPPEGFVESGKILDQVLARIRAAEAAENEVLTIFVPTADLPKYKVQQDQDIDFYSKLGVFRKAKTEDFTRERFRGFIEYIEKNSSKIFDRDGSIIKRVEENSSRALTEIWGEITKVDISQPVIIGIIDKSPRVHSTLMRFSINVSGRNVPFLAVLSVVHVNQRLLFLNTYKMFPVKEDIAKLRNHSTKWSAAIIAANP